MEQCDAVAGAVGEGLCRKIVGKARREVERSPKHVRIESFAEKSMIQDFVEGDGFENGRVPAARAGS